MSVFILPYIVRPFGLLGLFGLLNGVAVTYPVREKCPCLLPLRLPYASYVWFFISCGQLMVLFHPLPGHVMSRALLAP